MKGVSLSASEVLTVADKLSQFEGVQMLSDLSIVEMERRIFFSTNFLSSSFFLVQNSSLFGTAVWPDLRQFHQFGEILKVFGNFKGLFSIWQNFESTLAIVYY